MKPGGLLNPLGWALAALAWLACGLGWAAPARPLLLGAEAVYPLGAYAGLLDDPGGALDLAGAAKADMEGRFRPLGAGSQSLGYRPGATWARFAIANPTAGVAERWLHVNWLFQQSYILYLADASGRVERMEGGTRIPIASRLALFPVRLEPGQSKTAYLRVAHRSRFPFV